MYMYFGQVMSFGRIRFVRIQTIKSSGASTRCMYLFFQFCDPQVHTAQYVVTLSLGIRPYAPVLRSLFLVYILLASTQNSWLYGHWSIQRRWCGFIFSLDSTNRSYMYHNRTNWIRHSACYLHCTRSVRLQF